VYILFNDIKITRKGQMPIELSVKSCPVAPELHPSFDASSPPGCCPQSHEILLNKGMKYWNSGLNASSSRTFITRVHIAAAVIGWKRWGKERTGQTQLSLSFIPRWKPSVLFFCFLFFEISSPIWPNRGFPVSSFLDFMDNFNV